MQDLIKIEIQGETLELTQDEVRELIATAEDNVGLLDQVEIPVKHHFSKDVYAREITLPKGITAVGKIHKHMNLNILSKGEVTVISVDGAKHLTAPCTFVSSPGVKRLVYAHEETVWTTIHGTSETDVEKIEEQFIAKDYSEVVAIQSKDALEITGV